MLLAFRAGLDRRGLANTNDVAAVVIVLDRDGIYHAFHVVLSQRCSGGGRRPSSFAAKRKASAIDVKVGLEHPEVGKTAFPPI